MRASPAPLLVLLATLGACGGVAPARVLPAEDPCSSLAALSPATTSAAAIVSGLGLLSGPVPAGLTLFLPSNDALASTTRGGAADAAQLAALSDEARGKLAAAVLYSVGAPAAGALAPDALQSAGQVTTALPDAPPLAVLADDGWFADAALSLTDATNATAGVAETVQACSSVLYVLDKVLLPAGLLDPAFPSVAPDQAAAILAAVPTGGTPPLSPAQPLPSPAPASGDEARDAALALLPQLLAAQPTPGFDYLMLARQWGPSFCAAGSCSQPAFNLFTLHGLWPNNNDSRDSPASCSGESFDEAALPPALLTRMGCEWVSLKGTSASFWGYEWGKHGTCAVPGLFPNQTAYFAAAMALSEAWDINEALAAAGLDPLTARSASPNDVVAKLQAAWGVTPLVTCSDGMLQEVRTCFSTALQPIDCPGGSGCATDKQQELPAGSVDPPASCAQVFDNVPGLQ
ncbi:S-RNase [Micractinium conductrix]|uniref:S-RNase n=1 Tax=Micractinium conductrix TaxID=554055 RepID=A0A2P6VSG7_9CHLO|nr:S-RNase [Micractinium conductrix]|eukprot:PSC77036.1 S-RNase [Micractinium conductrix]